MIDVKHLLDTAGSSQEINLDFDFSGYDYNGTKPFANPVKIEGKISNKAGATYLIYKVSYTAVFQCDRCLKEFEREFSLMGEYTLTEEEFPDIDEDKYIVCKNGELNLEETVLFLILLNMPSKHLCNENCKGLCYKCGSNLNDGECKCSAEDNDNC